MPSTTNVTIDPQPNDTDISAMQPTSEISFSGSLGLDEFLQMSSDNIPQSQSLLAALLDSPPSNIGDDTKRKVSSDFDDIAYQNPYKMNHDTTADNVRHEDLDIEHSGDTDQSQKKKSGRKPLETTPSSKRKAQNRAAQRAFRERKERYVKNLEEKVSELESQANTISKENELLRTLVENLKSENAVLKTSSFTFEVPIAAAQAHSAASTRSEALNDMQSTQKVFTGSSPNTAEENSSDSGSPSTSSQANKSTVNSPPSSMGYVSDQGNTQENVCLANNFLSTPLFDSQGSLTTTSNPVCSNTDGDSTKLISTSATSNKLVFTNYREPSSGVFEDTFDIQPLPVTTLFGDQTTDVGDMILSPRHESSLLSAASNVDSMASQPACTQKPVSFEAAAQMVSCPELWEKISNHPNFDDLDIDNLCAELKKKAQCSGHGPVVKHEDVEHLLKIVGITL